MTRLGNERATVQEPLIRYATEIGWTYIAPGEAISERGGESGLLLYETFRRKLLELNPGVITPENVEEVVGRIEGVRATIEGNAEVLAWLRGEKSVFVPAEKRQRNVVLIDFDHLANNVFHVTDEWVYTNGRFTNRADIVFLVNGVPVTLVETKGATKPNALEEGLKQVRRYHLETPELVTAPQLFDVTHLVEFFYGVTWNLDRKALFTWKDEEPGNFERKVKRFFGRERFLKVLSDWIIFFKKDDELRKIVLRQHQTRAVERAVARALDPEKTRGLVWHTQGSGKTFTMITTAQQLLEHPAFRNEKPTVIMLVDRNELQAQLFGNLAAAGVPYELATSKRRLRELLAQDFRGLIVSMIHKFDGADADLSTRATVFLLVDEAHRSTGGDLGNYLVAALPNATMIGFTGTPIDRTAYGKGTFKVFGRDDERGYLDKYSIAESIADGTTLPLHYTLAPNEMLVPREQLEAEFLALAEAEGVTDIEELNRILDRAVNLKSFLKAAARIEKVAAFVARHFRENVEPLGYKAFLVGVDREACALYKHALDKHLPADYSAVVYTSAHNDSRLLAEFALEEEAEKQIRKAFIRSDRLPKILIVTEKLLTGFDAPVLYCMYLDKPMRDHALLQAIARVNRPYEETEEGTGGNESLPYETTSPGVGAGFIPARTGPITGVVVGFTPAGTGHVTRSLRKPAGFVLDFVGIFANLEKALAFDSEVVDSVIRNIDVLKERFGVLMATAAQPYLALCRGRVDDKSVERAIDALGDRARREEFYDVFQELENLYEIISPDIFLRPHLEDYARLSALYALIRNAFSRQFALVRDLMRKTEDLVRRHADTDGLTMTLPEVRIDEQTLASIHGEIADTSRVINLGRGLLATIARDPQQPYLISIGDRAESILEAYEERQISTGAAIDELQRLSREYLAADKERDRLGLGQRTYAFYQELMQAEVGPDDAKNLAATLEGAFIRYPEHRDNVAQSRLLKAELYSHLLPAVGKEKMVGVAEALIRVSAP